MNEENLPENYEADTEEFEQLYVLAWLLIIKALSVFIRLPQTLTASYLTQLEQRVNKQVTSVFTKLSEDAVSMSREQVTEAYTEGLTYARESVKNVGINFGYNVSTNTSVKPTLNNSHQDRLDKILTQTQDDLLRATQNTELNVKQLVRKVVAKEMNDIAMSGRIGKRSNMAKRVEEQLRRGFLEKGLRDADTAIIDKAKRKWKVRTYSTMVARTKMNMAYIDAIREEGLQQGFDLAIISTKPDTKDDCLNFEGMIISLNGLTEGYLTYEELKKSKRVFHPNCGHFVRPIASLAFVPPQQLEQHRQQMNKYLRK